MGAGIRALRKGQQGSRQTLPEGLGGEQAAWDTLHSSASEACEVQFRGVTAAALSSGRSPSLSMSEGRPRRGTLVQLEGPQASHVKSPRTTQHMATNGEMSSRPGECHTQEAT